MNRYTAGDGHRALAEKLKIKEYISLAKHGCCNNRIIRTTLKDSYTTNTPTFYIVGITFINRHEIPVAIPQDFEGRWVSSRDMNPQKEKYYDHFWTTADTIKMNDMFIKSEVYADEDIVEDLMYRVLSMINDLTNRGHRVLVYSQTHSFSDEFLANQKFAPLKQSMHIIDGLKWKALKWQRQQGIKFDPNDKNLPEFAHHPLPGEHESLNNFLIEYIEKHKLLNT